MFWGLFQVKQPCFKFVAVPPSPPLLFSGCILIKTWLSIETYSGIMRLRYGLLLLFFISVVPVSAYTYEMTWTYDNQGETIYNMSQKDLGLPVFAETQYQSVVMETSYDESVLLVLEDGFLKLVPINPVLVPIGHSHTIHASYTINSQSRPVPSINVQTAETIEHVPNELGIYTLPNALFPADYPEIIGLASELTAGEDAVLGKVSNLLDWFDSYSSYIVTEVPRPPQQTIRDPRGDCDDLSLLFITMCRSQGIPAYLQAGVVLSESIMIDETDWGGHYRYVFEGAGWHAWAMVYIPPWGWLPVDITKLGGMDPLETITEAYYWRGTTIVAWNISSHDYVLDETTQRDALIDAGVYWYQYDALILEESEQTNPIYLIILGTALLIGYFLYRYRS